MDTEDFYFSIYLDDNGQVGDLYYEKDVTSKNITYLNAYPAINVPYDKLFLFSYEFDLGSIKLLADQQYWVGVSPYSELTIASVYGSEVGDSRMMFWSSNLDQHASYPFHDGSDDMAMQLRGSPVPEPATMLLFGIGIVGLVGVRFRKKL